MVKQQKDHLREFLVQQDPLAKANDKLEAEMEQTVRRNAANIKEMVAKRLKNIKATIEGFLQRGPATPAEQEACLKIRPYLHAVKPMFDDIKREIEEIEREYSGA